MKRNIFKLFLNKFLSYPLWVKQVVYYRLWQNMQENNCDRYVINNPDSILAMHIPTLTFHGKQELWDKTGGLDSNIYNFLKFSHSGYSLLEISLNLFMSLEECVKLFLFCVEQELIGRPQNPEIYALAEFIAGKIQTGEYFLKIGSITIDQLDEAIAEQRRSDDREEHIMLGKMFVKLGFITEEAIKSLFKLKNDSKKRFVINPEMLPDDCQELKVSEKLEAQVKQLKEENKALKKTMEKIVSVVKNYDV